MFESVDLVFLCCLFLVVDSLAGKIQPPQNLSLSWSSDFEPQLNWTSPPHSMENCHYEVKTPGRTSTDAKSPWSEYRVMEGGKLELSVRTVCGQVKSDWVSVTTPYPDLVQNFQCSLESSKLTYCSWIKAPDTQDLRFYYELFDDGPKDHTPLKECSAYRSSDKTGCNLTATTSSTMWVLLNGTVDNKPVRNTFKRSLLENVKPPPLNWTVTKANNEFVIDWVPPDIDGWNWTYRINYTKCNGPVEQKRGKTPETSLTLEMFPQCSYRMRIQAWSDAGVDNTETPWSEFKDFNAETDPNNMLYAAIIIPLVVAGLVLFTFMCCRKNKDKVFPKIPKPQDLLSDISDNHKSAVYNLHIEEEDTCRITLVTDPHTEKNIS